MTTFTVDAPGSVALLPAAYVLAEGLGVLVGDPPAAAPWASGTRDQLVACSFDPVTLTVTPLAELAGAVVEKPSWVLNGVGSLDFTISTFDPALRDGLVDPDSLDLGIGELALLGREVQWWRDGECRWAGVPVAVDVSLAGTATFHCYDLGWYLTRVFVGAAERYDWLDDKGQMETAGLPGWAADGTTLTRSTTHVKRGTYSAKLAGAGAAQITFVHDAQTVGQDLTVLVTAMCRLGAADADGDPIVSIQAVPWGESEPYRPSAANTASVTSDDPRSAWGRYTARCMMRPGVAHTVTVTIWNSGGGDRFFDDVRALRNDTTGYAAPGRDLTKHVAAIINTAQSAVRGKASFGLDPAELALTGTVEPLAIRHLEHTQIMDLLNVYTEREDGIDWWIHPLTRKFNIAPRKGRDRTDKVLSGWSVLSGGWVHDESERASSVVVIGDGDGVDRPEGGYVDRGPTGGINLDYLERPANGTPLSALDPLARQIYARRSVPQVQFDPITVPGSWWGTDCEVGDWFPVEFSTGFVRTVEGIRVQKVAHDLERDVLELT